MPNDGGRDAFLCKFDTDGSLLWSTQFGTGQSFTGRGVAVDAAGCAYLTGYTPGTGGNDAFLVKFAPIPEPAAFSLLALGWLAVFRHRRR